jgi:hypothetical protein
MQAKPPTETALEGQVWEGEVIIQGRSEKPFARMTWNNGFHDKECHDMLFRIAETMTKSNENVQHIEFMFLNDMGIISACLRDLIQLRPPFVTVIVKRNTKGTVHLELSKGFRKRSPNSSGSIQYDKAGGFSRQRRVGCKECGCGCGRRCSCCLNRGTKIASLYDVKIYYNYLLPTTLKEISK